MKLLILNFDGQRVVTSSITNASKIALRHFGQLYYSKILRIEVGDEDWKIQKYYLLVNTHTELLLVNQHTDIFENRSTKISKKSICGDKFTGETGNSGWRAHSHAVSLAHKHTSCSALPVAAAVS